MDIFGLFSDPFEGDFQALVGQLAAAQFLAFCSRAQRMSEDLGLGEDDLLDQIRDQIRQRPASAAYWIPEGSTVPMGMSGEPTLERFRWVRAQLALAGYLTGCLTELDLVLEKLSDPVYLCGHTFHNETLKIQAGSGGLSVLDEKDYLIVHFQPIGQFSERTIWGRADQQMHFVKIDNQPVIRLVENGWDTRWGEEDRGLQKVDSGHAKQYEEALAFMAGHLPQYFKWFTCMVCEITPLKRPGPHTIGSSSSDTRWGGLNIAWPASMTETIEMMIHESSHQYFHLLTWLNPMVKPDAKMYYSPLKKRERPLEKILLGYHAFANASLAFESLIDLGFGDDIQNRKECVDEYMRELIPPLEETDGLSELGEAIYQPLRKRIGHIFEHAQGIPA